AMTGVMKGATCATARQASISRAWAARSRKPRNSRKPFTRSIAVGMAPDMPWALGNVNAASVERATLNMQLAIAARGVSPVISITTKGGVPDRLSRGPITPDAAETTQRLEFTLIEGRRWIEKITSSGAGHQLV